MAKSAANLLFVDDEPSIRMTLPPVLQKAGFEVRVAESVTDALFEINARKFDAVISDLNIGEEGDGFLVTSAMRHVQPTCLTFILTGYPAFETALQAIHNRVDDYLVKPVDIDVLTRTLKEKLHLRSSSAPEKRLASVLRGEATQITREVLVTLKGANGDSSQHGLNRLLTDFLAQLESDEDAASADLLRSAREHGKTQWQAGRTPSAVAAEFRLLEQEAYRVAQKNAAAATDVSMLVADLGRFSVGLHSLLEESLRAYEEKPRLSGSKPVSRPKRRSTD